jgi:RNA polymerase sigma factor (sigma-70 family)
MRLVKLIQANVEREKNSQRLFELYWPQIISYFRRRGFSQEKSKDLTQETFLWVYKRIDGFRRDSSFEWWLKGIAESIYKNEFRRRKAEKRDGIEQSLDAPASGDERSPSPMENLFSPVASPLAVAEESQQLALRAALDELPPQMRRCCILRYRKGLKYQEIADLMQISIETVKAHLFQGRKRLGARLASQGTYREFATSSEEAAIALPSLSREEDQMSGSTVGRDQSEKELLDKIRNSLPLSLSVRYRELIEKRQAETLSSSECGELLQLVDEVEALEVERVRNLVRLARLQGKSVEQLIKDLGLEPPPDA